MKHYVRLELPKSKVVHWVNGLPGSYSSARCGTTGWTAGREWRSTSVFTPVCKKCTSLIEKDQENG